MGNRRQRTLDRAAADGPAAGGRGRLTRSALWQPLEAATGGRPPRDRISPPLPRRGGEEGCASMGVVQSFLTLALRDVVKAACEAAGGPAAGEASDILTARLSRHLTDHSQRLLKALRAANAKAWQALEIALAGPSWWGRC